LLPDQQQNLRPASGWGTSGGSQGGIEHRREGVGGSLVSGELAKQTGDPGDTGQRIGIDPNRRDTKLAKAACNGCVLARVVENDEIRAVRDHGLDVGLDAIAEVGDRLGRGRIVAVARAADDSRVGPDGEKQFGCSGYERDHSARRHREPDGITGIVHDREPAARRRSWKTGGQD
jgi:hypothetical protein